MSITYMNKANATIGTTTAMKIPSDIVTHPFHCSVNIFQPSLIQSPKRTCGGAGLLVIVEALRQPPFLICRLKCFFGQQLARSMERVVWIVDSVNVSISDRRRRDHPWHRHKHADETSCHPTHGNRCEHQPNNPPHERIA